MIELINQYCNGYAITPIIETCRKYGLFELLVNRRRTKRQDIITGLKANAGYLTIALEALEAVGCLESENNDTYLLKIHGSIGSSNLDLTSLYKVDPQQLVRDVAYARMFSEKIEQLLRHVQKSDSQLARILEGALVIPLVSVLKQFNEKKVCKEIAQLEPRLAQSIAKLFISHQWMTSDRKQLTTTGKQLLQTPEFETAVSFRSLLSSMDDLLFGDHESAHSQFPYIDEQVNISFGGMDRGAHFKDLKEKVVAIFDRLPLEQQPQTVVNIGCGDGLLLSKVCLLIGNTLRGQHIEEYPLSFIGVCYSQRELEQSSEILSKEGIKHKIFLADINKPHEIWQTLGRNGVTSPKGTLYIQSFIGQHLRFEGKHIGNKTLPASADDQQFSYLDDRGKPVDASMVLSFWQKHLETCAQGIGESPLLLLENCVLSPTSSRHIFHNLSHRYLVSAESFLTLAASAGLFNQASAKYYRGIADCGLHHLTKRDYIVRIATRNDLEILYQLEELCWTKQLRTPRLRIQNRLKKYRQGQFVLEKDGKVLGVIYSQRIADADKLEQCNMDNVHNLHTGAGSIIQLLAVNIHPDAQNFSYGDQLLEFMLQRCSLIDGVEKIVAVTLCKNYEAKSKVPFKKYIQQQGKKQDPILAFHQSHGAKIIKPLADYRPRDISNRGYGVLIEYNDLENRVNSLRHFKTAEGASADGMPISTISRKQINEFIQASVANLLDVDMDTVDFDRPLMEMGLNSVDLLSLQRQIEEKFHQRLQPGFFFEYSNCKKVVNYLATKLEFLPSERRPSEPVKDKVIETANRHTEGDCAHANENNQKIADLDIAVIGISCKLPGGIDSPDKLWQVLTSEKCVISSYPRERGAWPGGIDQPGIDHGGFMNNADAFDASFFRISPREAQILDPQQRILLELAWACFEDAGIVPFAIKGGKTGVFVGASNSDYSRLVQDSKIAVEAHNAIGSSLAVLANRISYYFDFTGPSLLIDTACSSSLVALHTAIQSLRAGECSEALVGGVNLICHPDLSVAYHKAGMLSPDARCKVFDAKANGYVRSEGAVVMLLKPLRKAVEDQNQIHAVIKGSSINHGGLAAGLTVPNPQKQSELLVAAWENARISAQDISYIEAHGTGTSLGDPIEMQGIQTAYLQVVSAKHDRTCGIGSIKSNLGHLESAAGLTGLLKVILSMKNHALPATINFAEINPKIRFEDTPFYIQKKLQRWETTKLRLAGVSSFGSGGTNAHVVVQEYMPSTDVSSLENDHLFVLSAVNQEGLHEYAGNVIEWLEEFATDRNFCDAIYSWQTGRTAMKHRLAIKAKDRKDLTNKLRQWVANNTAGQTWYGVVKSSQSNPDQLLDGKPVRQLIEQSISERDLGQLGVLWISGVDIDWRMLYKGRGENRSSRRLISLPTYPFAKERYWINSEGTDQSLMLEANEPQHDVGVLFASPSWQLSETELLPHAEQTKFARRYIFLCDMPQIKAQQIEALLPGCHCVTLLTGESDIAGQYIEIALACFQEIQRILTSRQSGDAIIQIVAAHTHEQTFFAGLSGLLKTAKLENPLLTGQLILTDPQISTDRLSEQLLKNQRHPQDLIIKYDSDARHALRWQTSKSTVDNPGIVFNNSGTYLITGGLGGLGILFAKEILRQTTDTRIILTGRSELTNEKQTILSHLSADSRRLSYVQTDINDLDQVRELVAAIKNEHKNLKGIIHCAGTVSGNYIFNKTLEEVHEILKPKVTGTYNLDIVTKDMDLDFLVLFSSIASVIGLQGLADYATANGFMDHFASYRNYLADKNLRHGKTLSINWPLWQEGGMAMDQGSQDRSRHALGMLPMRTTTGIKSFHELLSLPFSQVLVMEGILSKVEASFAELNPIFTKEAKAQPVVATHSELLHKKTLLRVKQLFGEVISLSISKIDENEALLSYGIDSIFITHLNKGLSKVFGEISKTLFFEYRTLADLTTYLTREYASACLTWTGLTQQEILLQNPENIEQSSDPVNSFSVHSRSGNPRNDGTSTQQQIAIIGISGMYPQAANLDEYWDNFRMGRSCISEIPSDRWDLENFYDPDKKRAVETGKSYCKWGGFVNQFSQFDPLFFGISPREAMNMDPQERLFLQAAWQALESSGYTRSDLKNKYKRRVGVFAGVTKTGYDLYGSQFSNGGEKFHPRTSFGSIANRVSYFLDVSGASMPIDTMCSSSLTAIHEACEQINRGECNLAFAGGVNLYLHPSTYVWLSAQLMLSKDGLCRSFGAGASGFVPGEGVGVVLLKPLAAAIHDNDTIHGVILASHVNHGGKTNGYFVPNPNAHAELIRHTIDKAGISAREISYIEAHGTGTELGDPIEVTGLQQAFAKDSQDTGYCKIGSTKSNIGHLEAAAGIAGLTKILLQMKHGQIAPSLHSEVLNPNIDFAKTPFIVNQSLTTWDAPLINGQQKPRIAGISSFGAGGVNAHIIVQEYVAPKQAAHRFEPSANIIVPLSARTTKQIREKAKDLLEFILSAKPKSIDLHAMAYTLQVGREAMDERLGFIVNSVDKLVEKLQAYIAGEPVMEDVFQGQLKSHKETISLFNTDTDFQQMIDRWIAHRKLSKLLDLWVKGIDLDWNKFYGQSRPQRICLPTYPFADERYWIDSLEPVQSHSGLGSPTIHPLSGSNKSDLFQQRYATAFNGEESEKAWDKKSYLYKWEEYAGLKPKVSARHNNVLIVCSGSSYQFENTILDYYSEDTNCKKTVIRLSDRTKLESENEWLCGIYDVNGFQTCLRDVSEIDALYFLSMTQKKSDSFSLEELMEGQESNEVQLLRLIKCLKEENRIKEKVDTYILTLDKYALNDHSCQPLGAGVTGFAYSLAQGNYQFQVRNLDLFSGDLVRKQGLESLFLSILKESPADRGEVFKIQSGKRFRQTFYRLNWDRTNTPNIQRNGVYLIVGGSGTVGQIFTRNLIQKYNATVIWIGRSAKDSESIQKTLRSFGEQGSNLIYVQADVTELISMQQAFQIIKNKYHKINGAIFSGMVFDFENSIVQTSETDFRSIVDIKTKGSWVFYKVLENEPLDFMCYFSSGQAYSFSGAAKLVGYATAITSSDSLVRSLQKVAKFPVGIINWGYWKDTVKRISETQGGIRTGNFDALEGQEGFECFEQFVNELHLGRLNQVLCLNISPHVRSLMHCPQEEIMSLTSDGMIRQKSATDDEKQSTKSLSLPERSNHEMKKPNVVRKASPNIREYIWDNILSSLSRVLQISSESIDPNIAFSDYGIDSILGVKFIDQVNTFLSISLNTAIIFEYASIDRLCDHIVKVYRNQVEDQMKGQADSIINEAPQVGEHKEVVAPRIDESTQHLLLGSKVSANGVASLGSGNSLSEIAVVGMSGKFPKAENVKEFWENLTRGVDGIEELPAHYLDQENYFSTKKQPGKTRCKWGGILAERDCFDPLFFNISPKEAESMNPHQRLVLQESWKALEDAGYNPKDLSGQQTGVFIGAEPAAYLGDGFTGYSDAIIASRLSYIVNLRGPSIVVNTGCSSSAVALHLACESLRSGESDIALAGGVHACMGQYVQIVLDQIEMLSPSGRCFTFDDAGDGTILSEGVGVVVLKRLEDAIAAGDSIYGVICGSGINQDGASNGITAPNGAAQEELFTSVYNRFHINPESISYVEAHGTATKLGDPVEANALVRTFKKFSDNKEYCAIGSVKSYIGHTSAAAGVVGLIRILLSIQHKQIPKLLHFKKLNPLIEFRNSPFYINTQLSEWKSSEGTPRMAALNSFGHSGTNAHLVIREYIPEGKSNRINRISTKSDDAIIALSAKTTEQLQQKVSDLLAFIRTTDDLSNPFGMPDLEAMAYTLQTGREAMEERLGMVVSSIEQLAEKLQAYLNGSKDEGNFYQGYVKRNRRTSLKEGDSHENIEELIGERDLSGLVRLWVKGFEFDWKRLYGENRPGRANLPTYPFAKEKYWIDTAILPNRVFSETKGTFIHPLLHNNTSDLRQQKYTSTFNGSEFFLRDHRVNGQRVLPGVAYLEMARTAAQNAAPFAHESGIIELHNVVWSQPIVVAKSKTISIALTAKDDVNGVCKQIGYEIYCPDTSKNVVHSQGQVVLSDKPALAKLDLAALRGQMNQSKFEKSDVYRIFAAMGIDFGPSHQSLVSIDLGEKQLLAQLSLPDVIGTTLKDYVFHPSIMDGALQSCNGLMVDLNEGPRQSVLPYALKQLRIISPCTKEMIAWVRYSQGCRPGAKIIKLDLDICDLEGNICVQMLEFSTRVLENRISISNEKADSANGTSYTESFYERVVTQIVSKEISVEKALELE